MYKISRCEKNGILVLGGFPSCETFVLGLFLCFPKWKNKLVLGQVDH